MYLVGRFFPLRISWKGLAFWLEFRLSDGYFYPVINEFYSAHFYEFFNRAKYPNILKYITISKV